MVRRSFRIGLRLGLLVAVGIAVMKTVRSRRSRSESPIAAPPTWEPIRDDPPAHEAALDAPTKQPRDEVGEPILEPTPSEDARLDLGAPGTDAAPSAPPTKKEAAKNAPAKKAPAKKAAAKKPTAAKKAAPAKKAAKKAAAAKAPASAMWVAAEGGACPPTHPVKAKLISQIFRLPGMASYDRMRADRCYRDAASAEADGLTEAKR